MPGVQSIKWTDTNVIQAFYAMIHYGAVKVEDDIAELVAAHLGNGCTTTAIHNLIRTRRASFKPGVMPALSEDSSPSKARKRKSAASTDAAPETPKKPRTKSAPKKPSKQVSPDSDSDLNLDVNLYNDNDYVPAEYKEEVDTKQDDNADAIKTEE